MFLEQTSQFHVVNVNNGQADPYFERKYVEFSNETIYDDLTLSSATQAPGEISSVLGKKSINFPVALEYWLGKDPFLKAAGGSITNIDNDLHKHK